MVSAFYFMLLGDRNMRIRLQLLKKLMRRVMVWAEVWHIEKARTETQLHNDPLNGNIMSMYYAGPPSIPKIDIDFTNRAALELLRLRFERSSSVYFPPVETDET